MHYLKKIENCVSAMSLGPLEALEAEIIAFDKVISIQESAEVFKTSYERLKVPLINYGRQIGAQLPALKIKPTSPPTVGFFVRNDQLLAHHKNVHLYLQGNPKGIRPVVYVQQKITNAFDSLCEVREIAGTNELEMWQDLRKKSVEDSVSVMMFVHPIGLAFATSMGVAPKHIWWCMKYHGLELPAIDAYFSTVPNFAQTAEIDGRQWLCCHNVLPDLLDPSVTAEANEIKRKFDGPIMGCLGRHQKLLDRRYAAAIDTVLRACPDAHYLWSAREIPESFVSSLKEEGVTDRCHFIGWVNTKVYAQVFDVYLDSFPFASGHTTLEAMAAGCPIVVLLTNESIETSNASMVMPVYSGEVGTPEEQSDVQKIFDGTLPYFSDIGDYTDHAIKLIKDVGFRKRCGDAGRTFALKYMEDVPRHVEQTTRHILATING